MRRAFETETEIDRPVAQVWRELTDWEHAPRWMTGIEAMSCAGGTAPGSVVTFWTRGRSRTGTIAAVEPERALIVESVQGGVTARYTYRLRPSGSGTTARLTAEVATTGPWTLLGPVVRGAIRRADAGQLDALRDVLEGRRV
ncbi:SRPBCC family protein [Pseudonocardia humida]|uniref:SRPBCC family protein n=1 Tax=Pseudonocardia humida TaxID=2800819 RepID=A0ABT0ZTR3_9PSEU|nr:SRPBCC family protein [Pseudonocardia humida]MCO1654120.1 SRPBCC family protein [Pseudonocardia humida]